ncbi:MAG: TerC family protein [Rhizobiaceae bacterium]|nr:TerC family protein [Hyphomicrobiales bacterium]NRB32221.1 TerC family protein [Rhizobiaceae bacterium]
MIELLYDPAVWASFLTLTVMEIVLGIDNIVFISVIINKLPPEQAERARRIGLALALIFRIVLLMFLAWIIGLKAEVFSLFGHAFSWRDLILLAGGIFLVYKATAEIHEEFEGETEEDEADRLSVTTFANIIGQIIVIDLVFSVDSIVTAIGMAEHVEVMIAAVIVAVAVMYVASGTISDFIKRHPTTKMLALSFLLLIGVSLVADGMGFHIPRGYIYAAIGFSVMVEAINILAGRNRKKKS